MGVGQPCSVTLAFFGFSSEVFLPFPPRQVLVHYSDANDNEVALAQTSGFGLGFAAFRELAFHGLSFGSTRLCS